jgi:hypothetical protein
MTPEQQLVELQDYLITQIELYEKTLDSYEKDGTLQRDPSMYYIIKAQINELEIVLRKMIRLSDE